MFLLNESRYAKELLVLPQQGLGPFRGSRGKLGFLLKRSSSRVEGRISWFFLRCVRKLGIPLALRRGPQGPVHVGSGKFSLHASFEGPLRIPLQSRPGQRSSSGVETGTSGFLSSADMDLGFLWHFHRGVRPHLMWRHANLLSSQAVTVVSGFLSS